LKRLRRLQADHFVGQRPKTHAVVNGPDGSGRDDLRRVMLPQCTDCGFHRRTGRQAIVDHNHRLAAKRRLGTIAVVRLVASLELSLLARDDLVHHRRRDTERRNRVLAEDAHATGRDCADGELRVSWGSKLSNEEHVEWCAKCPRDFKGDRDSAAREREDDDVVAVGVRPQGLGEVLSSLMPIAKRCICHMVLLNDECDCNWRSMWSMATGLCRPTSPLFYLVAERMPQAKDYA